MQLPHSHEKAVTSISVVMLSNREAIFATSSSDCSAHLWNIVLPLEAEGLLMEHLKNLSIVFHSF
mgnify:CR=1 FL=1